MALFFARTVIYETAWICTWYLFIEGRARELCCSDIPYVFPVGSSKMSVKVYGRLPPHPPPRARLIVRSRQCRRPRRVLIRGHCPPSPPHFPLDVFLFFPIMLKGFDHHQRSGEGGGRARGVSGGKLRHADAGVVDRTGPGHVPSPHRSHRALRAQGCRDQSHSGDDDDDVFVLLTFFFTF